MLITDRDDVQARLDDRVRGPEGGDGRGIEGAAVGVEPYRVVGRDGFDQSGRGRGIERLGEDVRGTGNPPDNVRAITQWFDGHSDTVWAYTSLQKVSGR